jgi:hypothetical protein
LRCENYFQAQQFFECRTPGQRPRTGLDELRLPSRITSGSSRIIPGSSIDLTPPHHAHRLNAFQSSLNGLKALEALRSSHLPDKRVILLDYVDDMYFRTERFIE